MKSRDAQDYHVKSTRLIARDSQVNIRHLKRRIAYLEDQALKLVLQDWTLKRAYQHLCSVPGIAQTSALRLLAELAFLPEEMEPPQWGAHAGLDPKPKQLGRTRRPGSQTQTIRDRQPAQTHLENRE